MSLQLRDLGLLNVCKSGNGGVLLQSSLQFLIAPRGDAEDG